MHNLWKWFVPAIAILFLAQSSWGYDPSKHAGKEGEKGGGKGHHGYGRPKGPPADIPAHIKERTSPDGKGINLNNSQIGVEGMSILANSKDHANVVSLALQGNKLGDEGARILAASETFKHVELLNFVNHSRTKEGHKEAENKLHIFRKNLTSKDRLVHLTKINNEYYVGKRTLCGIWLDWKPEK